MKVVVITGGTKGLGRALSLQFGSAGYKVIALYRSDKDAADDLDKLFLQNEIHGRALQVDITGPNVIVELAQQPEIDSATSITLLLNACAPFTPQGFHTLNTDDFAKQLNVTVQGSAACVLALLKKMLKIGNSTIVGILSSAINPNGLPEKGFGAYATAKYGLLGLMRSLVAEYGDRGLRILTVSPGFMETELTSHWNQSLKKNTQDPQLTARKIFDLVENTANAGRGENFTV